MHRLTRTHAGKRTQRCRYCGQPCVDRTCTSHRDLEALQSIAMTAGYELARDGEPDKIDGAGRDEHDCGHSSRSVTTGTEA
jgi:hypothetical protein